VIADRSYFISFVNAFPGAEGEEIEAVRFGFIYQAPFLSGHSAGESPQLFKLSLELLP